MRRHSLLAADQEGGGDDDVAGATTAAARVRPRLPRAGGVGKRGTTALEFALLGPALVTAIFLGVEIGQQVAVGAALDYGAQRAARLGAIGNIVPNGETASDAARKDAVIATVLSSTGGLLQGCQALEVVVASYGGFAATTAEGASGPGTGGQVVRYQLKCRQPFMSVQLVKTLTGLENINHVSTVYMANEPFPDKPKT